MAGAEFYAFLKNDYQAQLAKVRRWLKSLPAGEATYSVEEMTALESIPTNTSIWITQGLARFMRCKATDFIKLDGEGTGASDYPSMKSDNAKKFFLNYWL